MSTFNAGETWRCKFCTNTVAFYATRERTRLDHNGNILGSEVLDPAWCNVNLGPIQGGICQDAPHGQHEPNIPPLNTVEDVQRFLEGSDDSVGARCQGHN